MDTGTHFVMGIGLAGLAFVDPAVAGDPAAQAAVAIGTVIGSQAPDFDGLLRLHSNAAYVRNHRGNSHSLPAIAVWSLAISAAILLIFPSVSWLTIATWVTIAVCLHVFVDLFNSYGTKALSPFSRRWIAWNIIHIFDPFIFASHVIAILLWLFRIFPPQLIFPVLYAVLILYYIGRTMMHIKLRAMLPRLDPLEGNGEPSRYRYHLLPTVYFHHWNVLKQHPNGAYTLGELKGTQLTWMETIISDLDHPAVQASRTHPDIVAFLSFSSFPCVKVMTRPWGYEVRWMDARYLHRKQYPFVGVLLLSREMEPLGSYVGWLNQNRIEKRLNVHTRA